MKSKYSSINSLSNDVEFVYVTFINRFQMNGGGAPRTSSVMYSAKVCDKNNNEN